MKIHSPSEMLLTNTESVNRKKSYIQGVGCNIPKIFQIVLGMITKLSWKFDENRFIRCFRNVTKRHDGAPSVGTAEQFSQVWNNSGHLVCYVLSDICCKFRENTFTRLSVIMLLNTNQENTNINPGSKRLNVTSLIKCSRLFLAWCLSYPKNFMKIHSSVFPQCC